MVIVIRYFYKDNKIGFEKKKNKEKEKGKRRKISFYIKFNALSLFVIVIFHHENIVTKISNIQL